MNGLMEKDFRLGAWVVAPRLNSLSRNGEAFHVEPKVMQVLVCLAEAGDVVSKEKLMRTVWTDTFVTDDVLTRSISELRKVFEDDPKRPQYIQTIPKGGYRLLVPAEEVRSGNGAAGATPAPDNEGATTSRQKVPGAKRVVLVPVLVSIAVLLLLTSLALKRLSTASRNPGGRAMLAVVPFQNLNNDPAQDYFADGLTAEMISQLGRLPSDRLGVIAWNSMMKYKGVKKSEDEIGGDLGANYVLEGTVRRAGDHVRITAELVKIGDRSHIWANSYDGELGDVLAVQSRVAREIASEIQLRLTPEQQARLGNPASVDPAGYDAYLKGKVVIADDVKAATNKGAEHLQKAIQLTPGYAPPYVGLASYYRGQASLGLMPSKTGYAAGRSAVEKALQIDPDSASAHRELGWIYWRSEWDFAAAEKEFRKALELNPGEALTHEEYSHYLKGMGRYDEALVEINRCLELNPLASVSHANAGTLLGLMHRYDSSMEHFRRAIQLDPQQQYNHERLGAALLWQGKNREAIGELGLAVQFSNGNPERMAWLGYAYAVNGRKKEALDLLEQLRVNPGQKYVSPFHVALLFTGLGDNESAFRWLEKAYEQRDEWMVYLKIYPEFSSLRSDPRFQQLVRRVGLIQ
ncbi:MAG TPA: winged helix-turn-helix domain-containing protein [Candidatus Acidoferrales bacterium]|nr:winged helix-turn-helix domain-containing protein [Candidatus Acidoferrales bacterium]